MSGVKFTGVARRPLLNFPVGGLVVGALLLAVMFLPIAIGNDYFYHIAITICVFAALATAWNIVGGYAGQLSLGHAVYYGIGAYTGVLLVQAGVTPWIGMFVGAILAAGVAVLISYPCFRLNGPFYALATIAFLEVFRVLALHFRELTGGAIGLMVPLHIGWQWMIFRGRLPSLEIAFGLLLVTLVIAYVIRHRRMGFYLIATRERESAARAAGIPTVRVRLIAAMISAALSSIIGTFYAMYVTFIEPSSIFSLTFSIEIAMFALIGGLGTVFGPLLGAILLVPVAEFSRGWLGAEAQGLHGFVYGVILLAVVLFIPDGIVGFASRFLRSAPRTVPSIPQAPSIPATARDRPMAAVQMDDILRVEGLQKHFGGLHVTDDVSFTLKAGEILGVIGPNGAGKTTVFNMLSGFVTPDSGSVSVRDVAGKFQKPRTPGEFAAIGVGRTFQIVQPFASMTVEENLMVGAFFRHADVGDAREAARETADRMGLYPMLGTEARSLTIGGLKRLEVARVMAMQPRILLLDEVMAGINQTDVRRAIDLMRSIQHSGISIIAIEHVMQAVMSLSDRVIVISAGQIIAHGLPQDVVRDPQVVEAYLGKEFAHAPAQ